MIVPSSHPRRFRWVFCQLEVLRHCFPANLRHTLEELPKSLDETYKRILGEINNANREHAYRLLQCLTVALRPLRVEELAEALAFDLTAGGIPKLNADWRWEDKEEAVLSACSSLVSVIINGGSRIVQFSHFSVKEFLISNRLASCMEEASQFHIPIEPSHAILAQACLGVFLCLDDRSDKDSVNKIPLYRYVAKYWVKHVQVGNVESQIKDTMDYFFDMDNPHFSAWARIEHQHDLLRFSVGDKPASVPRPAAPLYFAAWRGFHGLVERLIVKHSHHVNQFGGYYGTPLHAAVFGGHTEVSRLLFTHGADINSRCADDYTPLHVASDNGHFKIGKWLLDHGTDVNAKQMFGATPLHLAASHGHLDACRILLERNAEVNSLDDKEETPLHHASMSYNVGSAAVVRLLLDYGADVQLRNLSGQTASEVAIGHDEQEIVRLLSQHGVE
jgi:ankyrin repeat protein